MFQSETYEVLDTLFYDKAVTGQKNSNWSLIRLDTPVTDETGTLLTANGNYAHYVVVNTNQRFSVPVAVEFDVLETSYSSSKPSLNIVDNGFDNKSNLDSNSHYKFEIDSTGFKCYKNGTYISTVTGNLSNVRISLYIPSTGATLKYTNFMIYPI